LSQHELPLWVRGVGALLLPFAGWWFMRTPVARDLVGDSVAVIALGVVAAFLLLGTHVRLGLWPAGPWRRTFSVGIVVTVAVLFGLVVVAFDPFDAAAVQERMDPGAYLLAAAGVAAWGFAWSFVAHERFAVWFGIAAGAALVPLAAGTVGLVMLEGGSPAVCLLSTRMTAPCDATALQVFGFTAAVGSAVALVSFELAFRRFLLGHPDRAGVALVLAAALVAAGWSLVFGTTGVSFAPEWWLVGLASVSAGALYVLSGSLVVSGLFTGLAFASRDALFAARAAAEIGPLERLPVTFPLAHAVVALALAALVWRRKGLLQGLR
jgi:hypothetical protein